MPRRMSDRNNDTRCHYRAAGVAESVPQTGGRRQGWIVWFFLGGGVREEGVVVVNVARNARHLPGPGKRKDPPSPYQTQGPMCLGRDPKMVGGGYGDLHDRESGKRVLYHVTGVRGRLAH